MRSLNVMPIASIVLRNWQIYLASHHGPSVFTNPRDWCPLVELARQGFITIDRGHLQIILRGKRLGFSLAEIGEYMHLYDANPSQSEQLTMLLEKVNQRLNSLERQKSDLTALAAELNDIRLQALDALNRTNSQARTGTN